MNGIIRNTQSIDIPSLAANAETTISVPFANVTTGATVYVSPDQALTGIVIAWARVSSAGNIRYTLLQPNRIGIEPAGHEFPYYRIPITEYSGT